MVRITRGDTANLKFYRKACDGTIIGVIPSEITFTMRKTPTAAIAIQKTYTGGGIYFDSSDQSFHILLTHDDTAGLEITDYGFDVQVEDEDYVKTIAVDKIKITVDYTYQEVSA